GYYNQAKAFDYKKNIISFSPEKLTTNSTESKIKDEPNITVIKLDEIDEDILDRVTEFNTNSCSNSLKRKNQEGLILINKNEVGVKAEGCLCWKN
ncbi:unnamed protein product, partial [Brachionus calyciflorus]